MDNLLPRSPRKALVIYICLLNLNPVIKAKPTFLDKRCTNAFGDTVTYDGNSTFERNVDTLLSVLSSNSNAANGFYNFTAGSSPPEVAYGLFLCRGDLSAADCQDCVVSASRSVLERCPRSKDAVIWYDPYCMVRYSNTSFFSVYDGGLNVICNHNRVRNATHFTEVLGKVMDNVAIRAASADSSKKFATAEANYSSLERVYGLAQCTPDLSHDDCYLCLRIYIYEFHLCNASSGARVYSPNCYVHYETSPFYNASVSASPLPQVLPSSPPSPPTSSSSPGNGGISLQAIIAIVVPFGVAIMLFTVGFYFLTRRAKKKKYNSPREDTSGHDILTLQLQYDLDTIQTATNNFSDDNKIGEGSFGSVYKGLLSNGQEVAVKRLSRTSEQGVIEFKNEVVLAAKLQHRSLVKLLGFCWEGEEKIIIYEFVPNKSLDYFLFDPQEQAKLDWSTRYKIIVGVARGMLYLHEDSQLRIIHRDLKASNILLDGDMNAKVSDFGMARIFGADQTQGQTSRVVGTFGYMSPEYALHGQFSVKSDVFSFGVLVLEIISGKKNYNFYQSDGAADLLSYAWKLWREGMPLNLMDPTLEGSHSRTEVTRCIHIALLCVQDDPDARPSMETVVLMLNSYSTMLSLPQQHGFLGQSSTG